MSASSILIRSSEVVTLLLACCVAAGCAGTTGSPATAGRGEAALAIASAIGAPRVGPRTGSVMVVGGGQQGPEVFAKFIELAGGPDALIVDVPTAGGDSIDTSDGGRGLKSAGARNVVVYHTTSHTLADADSFVAKIANARGVWFGGGRHYRLVNSYAGTK